MIPLTVNPTVIILTNAQGEPRKTATNVASDLEVVSTQSVSEFEELSKGRPFVKDLGPTALERHEDGGCSSER
jgi:hypothetical protein